jgi:hypothetical protein
VHQTETPSLKTLAARVLRESKESPSQDSNGASGAHGAVGARGASGASMEIRNHLLAVAAQLGIPGTLVDRLPVVELEATADQMALCADYMDGNGDPLAQSLLRFYLRTLADRLGDAGWRGV